MTLGRASFVDLPLADRNVSHLHARLRIEGDAIVVDDLNSRNGTWVGGTKLDAPRTLQRGDRLQLGGSTILFGANEWVDDVPATPAPAPIPVAVPEPPAPARPTNDPESTQKPHLPTLPVGDVTAPETPRVPEEVRKALPSCR